MKVMSKILVAALAAAGFAGVAQAESNVVTGAGALSASAKLDLTVVIPKYLALQVGTGTIMTNGVTVDSITFSPAAANVGNSSVIAGVGGDLTGGAVTAIVRGNGGNISIVSDKNVGATMNNGVPTETIPYTDIGVVATALAGYPTLFATPSLGAASTVTATAVNKVVRQGAVWTYTYLNTTVPPAGTYGAAANGGRVTYTATLP